MLRARKVIGTVRVPASGNDDVPRRHRPIASGEVNPAGSVDDRALADDLHIGVVEPFDVGPLSRSTSRATLSVSRLQSKSGSPGFQPKATLSSKSSRKCAAVTISFFGTQPRMTQVPPTRSASASATLAPCCAGDPGSAHAARSATDDEEIIVGHGGLRGNAPDPCSHGDQKSMPWFWNSWIARCCISLARAVAQVCNSLTVSF